MSDPLLISKRFLHEGNRSSGQGNTKASGGFSASLFAAAIGTLIGFGGKSLLSGEGVVDRAACACPPKPECCVEKKCEDSACLRKMECEEEKIIKANCDLEKALKAVKCNAVEFTEAAMKAYCAAIKIVKEYQDTAYCIIDNDELSPPEYEETWCCLYKTAKERAEKVKDALQRGQCAWELLCRLRETICDGKNCRYTACNPLLVTAEEALTCAERELLNLKAKLDCVQSDHDMVDCYRDVISCFRKDLKCDVDKLIDSGECCIEFAEQEQALLIQMAYKRAIRAHKEVAQSMICSGNVPERYEKTII